VQRLPLRQLQRCRVIMRIPLKILAQSSDAGKRLDVLLRERLTDHTRSRIQDWIKRDQVLVDGAVQRASYVIRGTEEIDATPVASLPLRATAEDIALEILYEDDDLVAINKPAGMVVHAGAGVYAGTVVNALLHRFQSLSTVGGEMRPGIVHRLDRFTSGVLLVAKTDAAHQHLSAQFAAREVRKIYLTMVHGVIAAQKVRIDKPIARDPNRRERMTTRLGEGREAWSEFNVLRRYPRFTYLEVLIGTGRTHQIRVHLSSIGHAVVGDRLYGAPQSEMGRYFLHAHHIEFKQPSTGEPIIVEAKLAPELQAWIENLDAPTAL
jgi:23S rRNA pseudouridine1911/1915/1917 synthase